jgi:hypothetical protein
MDTLDPIRASNKLYAYGYWCTYWMMRNDYKMSRLGSLWLIWVARCYWRHTNGLTLLDP